LPAAAGATRPLAEAAAEASALPPEATGDAAPQTSPPGGRPGEGIRILFGEREDLLADVDSEVDENGFKW
jgi:hypothetical protein